MVYRCSKTFDKTYQTRVIDFPDDLVTLVEIYS